MADPAVADPSSAELWDLEQLAAASGLCDWMFDQFRDALGPTVVEVGAGIGTFSVRMLEAGVERLTVVEPEAACAAALERRFRTDPRVTLMASPLSDAAELADLRAAADAVVCQNVLEHIEDDAAAVDAMAAMLKPGGRLFLLVPAHQRLFGSLDREYGHQRRYDRGRLADVVEAAGLAMEQLYSFNLLGIPGWWLKGRRGATRIDARSLRAYEALLKGWRPVEDRMKPPIGLSLIARARRPV